MEDQSIGNLTVPQLKVLPEWNEIDSPKPTTKSKIVQAILAVREKKPDTLTVRCPVRGHKHTLEYVVRDDRPDLLVAYCGDRAVIQIANPEIHTKIESATESSFNYSVPSYDDKGE